MDPQTTWNEMLQSLIESDYDAAREFADSLMNWLDRGGFSPKALPELGQATCNPDSLASRLDKMVVSFVCATVRTES